MKNNDKKMLFGIGIVFLFLATVGFSYAYFSNAIVNNEVKDQVVETGTLSLRYVDGAEIVMNNIKPGDTITKTVYVANTGTLDASYNLVWQELVNEIANDEMVIEASCTRMNGQTEEVDGTCEGLAETPNKKIRIKENILIEPSIFHKYDITITFKEMNKEQNYNQNKKFTGVLGVKEYKAPETIYCTFDGEMVQGAEYVNGQYTYRYMQEGKYVSSGIDWNNITTDGWGVQLTDETSTNPVTSRVCTYINDKPVVSMSFMFLNSKATTIDLSNFDTSKVTNMSHMFYSSQATTLDISNFDTSNVTDMSNMFNLSKATTLDLSGFDTSKVTNMYGMFANSQTPTIDVSNFDTSKVTNMYGMFWFSQATTIDVSNFDTSKVTNMRDMFHWTPATTLDVSNFDTSNVTDMSGMFYRSQATALDVSNFDTSKVTNMYGMFAGSQATTLDVSNFDTSKVTNMKHMFAGSQATTLDLSNFDTSNVENMSYMFYKSKTTTLDLSNFDTSKVTNMYYMFRNSQATILDLSNFDTSNVTNMSYMFADCPNLRTIYASNKFVTTNVTNSSYGEKTFDGSINLVGGSGTVYDANNVDKTYARIDGGTTNPGYFTLKSN